jgi:uncharacterized membrane protein YhaH (DUF805 family)
MSSTNVPPRLLSNDEEEVRAPSETDDLTVSRKQEGEGEEALLLDDYAPAPNRCILAMVLIYIFLIILLFTWPRYVAKHWHGDGLSLIAYGMSIVFGVGLVAILVSLITLIVTIRHWGLLSGSMHVIGLFPMVCSIAIMIVVQILANIRKYENDFDHACGPDGVDHNGEACPIPKNLTSYDD